MSWNQQNKTKPSRHSSHISLSTLMLSCCCCTSLKTLSTHLLSPVWDFVWRSRSSKQKFLIAPLLAYASSFLACSLPSKLVPKPLAQVHFATTFVMAASVCIPQAWVAITLGDIGLISKNSALRGARFWAWVACRVACSRLGLPAVTNIEDTTRAPKGVALDTLPAGISLSCNHTSYFDAFYLPGQCLPQAVYLGMAAWAKSALADLPIVGWVFFSAVGSFKVFYVADEKSSGDTEETYNNFKIDAERQKVEMEKMLAYIKVPGNSFCWALEGRINKTPEKVGAVRFGTVKLAYENRSTLGKDGIFIITFWGLHQSWPATAAIGGLPAICVKSLSLFRWPEESAVKNAETGEVDVKLMCKLIEEHMQREIKHVKEIHDKAVLQASWKSWKLW